MIIDAVAAGPVGAGLGQAADIAPIVVGEEQGDVVRHPHAGVVIILHLLVERPDLGGLGGGPAGHFLEDGPLVADDPLEQLGGGALGHRLVAVATHADGDEALVTVHPLDALAPELAQAFGVAGVVPLSLVTTQPVDMGAHHRLVVRGADHHAHLVGETGTKGIVLVEALPHIAGHR